MKFLKRFFLSILFLSPFVGLYAKDPPPDPASNPPPPPPREGPLKRGGGFPEDDSDPFKLIYLKTFTNEDSLFLVFCFNKAIEPSSIDDATILVDDEPVETENITFSRDGHKFRIETELDEDFSIIIEGVKARRGFVLPQTEMDNITCDTIYKRDKESGEWQRFSL